MNVLPLSRHCMTVCLPMIIAWLLSTVGTVWRAWTNPSFAVVRPKAAGSLVVEGAAVVSLLVKIVLPQ